MTPPATTPTSADPDAGSASASASAVASTFESAAAPVPASAFASPAAAASSFGSSHASASTGTSPNQAHTATDHYLSNNLFPPPSTTSSYYAQVRMSPSVHHPSRSDSYPLHLFHQYPPKVVVRPTHNPTHMQTFIHTLPVELLSRIFLIGWQEDADPDDILTSQVTFEVLVSHVCHRWRDVALSNPVLWSIIHMRTIAHMQRASTYLNRNRHHLFDVHIDTCAEDEHIPGHTLFRDEFYPVFDIVVPHIDRWRSLHLKVRDLTCKAGARSVLSSCGGAPHLETLHLWHIENWGTPERLYTAIGPPPVVVFDQKLPMLKNIILTGVNLPWT